MGFQLTPKKNYVLPVESWGMKMQWENPILSILIRQSIAALHLQWRCIFFSENHLIFDD